MRLSGKIAFITLVGVTCCGGCEKAKDWTASVITEPDYKKGESLLGVNNDSAFYFFNKVAGAARDSLQVATSYNNMAAIQSDAGDYFGSQESLLTSLQWLDEKKDRDYFCLASDYNELGNTSLNLKNYDAAIGYYDKALQFSKDENFRGVVTNNKAVSFQKKGDYPSAIALYQSIIAQSRKDNKQYARVVSNMARTKWLQDSAYAAAPELLKALSIRKKENDYWGLNASYAHLADYYSHSQPDSALAYAEKRYLVAQALGSPDDEMEALQKLMVLNTGGNVKKYFIRYQFLDDSIQTARNNAKNQFALIRYDAEKNKAANLALQRDNTEKRIQLIQQRIILYGVLVALLFGTGLAIAWYRKRKQQMLWESQHAIRENQLKTSQKVHDVVANGLYRIMAEIEHRPAIDKEHLLDNIEALYERSRDISYEQDTVPDKGFDESLAELLISFAGPGTKVLVAGNDAALWTGVDPVSRQALAHIIQELMVNMKKHSGANNVVIKFERLQEEIKIQYSDDGTGLKPSFTYGNGLRNTENRIKGIAGRIIFDKQVSKGLKIEVYIPIKVND